MEIWRSLQFNCLLCLNQNHSSGYVIVGEDNDLNTISYKCKQLFISYINDVSVCVNHFRVENCMFTLKFLLTSQIRYVASRELLLRE